MRPCQNDDFFSQNEMKRNERKSPLPCRLTFNYLRSQSGVYVVLYGTSLYILLRKDGVLRSAPRLFMFVVTTAMFALGLTALALDTTLAFQQFARELSPFSAPGSASSSSPSWSVRRANIVTAVGATIACTIYVLSDVVCAWRAAVLWNYDRRVVAVLAFFVLGTTAAAGSDLGFSLRPLFKPSSDQLGLTQDGNSAKLDDHRVLILVGPTLATNVLSTSLIGIQVWRNRRVLISHLSRNSVAIRAEKVLAMLVESGFVYCCIWVLYLISTFQVLPKPGFAVMDAILPYIAGLYPTMVVIFIVLRKSPTFTITKRPASMHVQGH
ncbi:hypothetical protein BC826DRAFT_1042283 [Russula brevipes]|nr:hypothetical protein BC826DRAFT_1042283 [Russula brevipes]